MREDDGLTLVDTMLPQGAKKILAAAAELDAPITRIALTHAHGDHIGSLDAVKAGAPGRRGRDRHARGAPAAEGQDARAGRAADQVKGDYRGAKTKPDAHARGRATTSARCCVASPGHTPGHVAYLDERDRTLFCGDAFSTLGGVATSARLNPRFPLILMGTWNRRWCSKRALAARAGAGEPRPGPRQDRQPPLAAMDAAIARAS